MSRALDEALDRLARACATLSGPSAFAATEHSQTPSAETLRVTRVHQQSENKISIAEQAQSVSELPNARVPIRQFELSPTGAGAAAPPGPEIVRPIRTPLASELPRGEAGGWLRRLTSAPARFIHRIIGR